MPKQHSQLRADHSSSEAFPGPLSQCWVMFPPSHPAFPSMVVRIFWLIVFLSISPAQLSGPYWQAKVLLSFLNAKLSLQKVKEHL